MNNYENGDLIDALRFLFNFNGLDLSIDDMGSNNGLRFYTLFNRLDAVNCVCPRLKCNSLVSLNADITVPNGYTPEFDDTDRNAIIPVNAIQAVQFSICRDSLRCFCEEIRRRYNRCPRDFNFTERTDLLNALINFRCNAFNTEYEIGVDAIDLSNRPVSGIIIGYSEELLWVKSTERGKNQKFYLIPLDSISFILQK